MRINLKVEYQDGKSVDVTASLIDLMRFEEKFEISIVKLERDVKLSHLLFLAWTSLHRQKQTTLAFDAWVETAENVTIGDKSPK